MYNGNHCLAWRSKLQHRVALSSCEAELNAAVRAASEGLHLRNVGRSAGVELKLALSIDASATEGVLHRTGVGKVKHLDIKQLWIQEYVCRKELEVIKIPREQNFGDAMTHASQVKDERFFDGMGFTGFAQSVLAMSYSSGHFASQRRLGTCEPSGAVRRTSPICISECAS